jgi:Tfp pilus assembly protein PilF
MKLLNACTLAIMVGYSGCATSNSVAGQDAQRRGESEYDLARDAWLREGDPRVALSHALRALELDDKNAEAHHLVALLYLDLCRLPAGNCRLPEARTHAETALGLRKDYREARNTLGVVLIHEKRPADAVAVLVPLTTDILYTTPENAWGNLGWAYLELSRLDEATDALERSVAAQPRFCVGFYRLGLARERRGLRESAIEAYSQALQADPRCESLQEAYLGRARQSIQLGRLDSARADLDECVRRSRETPTGKECDSLRQKLK